MGRGSQVVTTQACLGNSSGQLSNHFLPDELLQSHKAWNGLDEPWLENYQLSFWMSNKEYVLSILLPHSGTQRFMSALWRGCTSGVSHLALRCEDIVSSGYSDLDVPVVPLPVVPLCFLYTGASPS